MNPPYRYLKAIPKPEEIGRKQPDTRNRRYSSLLAKGLIIAGVLVIGNVIGPILSYELFVSPKLKDQEFLSPVPVLGQQTEINYQEFEDQDLSRPEMWFPEARFEPRESKITHYTLSIPKFKIVDAVVEVDGNNLAKSLIQFPGTALPGKVGATVIFGHSILPQFFNPENYLSIFSLIPTLELGDEIIVKFDGITYTYKVIDRVEVKPNNLAVLEQPYDNEYLRLITCTPPGTYLRRAVITAALIGG